MIVYNCESRWFAKQDEANAFRRTLIQPRRWPVTRIRVESREDMVALLNALCGAPVASGDHVETLTTPPAAKLPVYPPVTPLPDWVPAFLIDKEGRIKQ